MTREEAQEILLLHRPGIAADQDADMAEALRLAASDPELGRWLEQHREFQDGITNQLLTIEPPPDLKAKILASAKPSIKPVSFWRRNQVLAMAASILLLLSLGGWFVSRDSEDAPTAANFRSRMTSFALRTYGMNVITNDPAVVRRYLASHGAPADFSLTPGLEKLPVKGGGKLLWQDQPVAMMCFSLTNNQTAFMFVVDERAMSKKPPRYEMTSAVGFNTVEWTKDGKVYLLGAVRPEDLLTIAPR